MDQTLNKTIRRPWKSKQKMKRKEKETDFAEDDLFVSIGCRFLSYLNIEVDAIWLCRSNSLSFDFMI